MQTRQDAIDARQGRISWRSTRHKSSLNKQRLHNRNIKENKIQSILNTATSHRWYGFFQLLVLNILT